MMTRKRRWGRRRTSSMGQISSTAMVWHTLILESALTRAHAHPLEVFSSVLMTRPPQSAFQSYPPIGSLDEPMNLVLSSTLGPVPNIMQYATLTRLWFSVSCDGSLCLWTPRVALARRPVAPASCLRRASLLAMVKALLLSSSWKTVVCVVKAMMVCARRKHLLPKPFGLLAAVCMWRGNVNSQKL